MAQSQASLPSKAKLMQFAQTTAPPPVLGPVAGLWLFQLGAIALAFALSAASGASDAGSNTGTVAVFATLTFLVGGLPHGAFDIHLAATQARLGPARLISFTALYVALFAIMLLGWAFAPGITLPIFIITAILHFSADWPETDEPLYRIALGFAPICAIGIGHIAEVEAIFAAMATPATALGATRLFIIVAPVTLLIAAMALLVMAERAKWLRFALFGALLVSLAILPPLIGFALFFCAFHTPRHLVEIRSQLPDWHKRRLVIVGASMTGLALLLGALALPPILTGGLLTAAGGFQLLAALAMPHQSMGLILRWLERAQVA